MIEGDFHFYRCKNCNCILTWDEEQSAKKTGTMCGCGGVKYSPTNPSNEEWESKKIKDYCIRYNLERDPNEANQ